MVYKLKPLELGLDFEDKDYNLGDTIDVQVTLTTNGDVNVREARVDLVWRRTIRAMRAGWLWASAGR